MPLFRKKKKADEGEEPFGDVFEDFPDIMKEMGFLEKMMKDMMSRSFSEQEPFAKRMVNKPMVYGFSMKIGPEGRPQIQEFGNIAPSKKEVTEEREPLVDIINKEKEIDVLAELPGVEKQDIKLNATETSLSISVDTSDRKYRKQLRLPAEVDPKSAKASYKNGVLEVVLTKLKPSKEEKKGEIKVE